MIKCVGLSGPARITTVLVVVAAVGLVVKATPDQEASSSGAGPSHSGNPVVAMRNPNSQQWHELYKIVFEPNNRLETVTRTMLLLRDLSRNMPDDLSPEKRKEATSLIDELLQLVNFSEDKCTAEMHEKIEFLIKWYKQTHKNLVIYLVFWRMAHPTYCVKLMTDPIKSELDSIVESKPDALAAMEDLGKFIESQIPEQDATKRKLWLHRHQDEHMDMILKYLKPHLAHVATEAAHSDIASSSSAPQIQVPKEDEFKDVLNKTLGDHCALSRQSIFPGLDRLFQYAVLDWEIMRHVPDRAFLWRILKSTCELIQDEKAVERMLTRYPSLILEQPSPTAEPITSPGNQG